MSTQREIDRYLSLGVAEGPLSYVPHLVGAFSCLEKVLPDGSIKRSSLLRRHSVWSQPGIKIASHQYDRVADGVALLSPTTYMAMIDIADAFLTVSMHQCLQLTCWASGPPMSIFPFSQHVFRHQTSTPRHDPSG